MTAPILQVRDLRVQYRTPRGVVQAVDGLSFDLYPGERLGLVGESGSGKTTAALSLLRLIKPPGHIVGGKVVLDGQDLLALPEEGMRHVRLAQIALVPQGAMSSLNPVLLIREQILDGLRDHETGLSSRAQTARVNELLAGVGLEPAVAGMYPHQLSGGMKQRVCIAIAISLRPKVIIADEPTSALDVVVQRRVMETLGKAQEEIGAAVILVGHDMGLMAQFVNRIGIMYAGQLMELSPMKPMFQKPLHPYARALIENTPSLAVKAIPRSIDGSMPSLMELPSGCLFHPRCSYALAACTTERQTLREVRAERRVACWRAEDIAAGAPANAGAATAAGALSPDAAPEKIGLNA
ncbi:MAG TPA: ABC transporter ATP-binding protein [Bauldia sp.]|nr:ABC transporter ATP-binding protein [Bauldia sp.]